MSPPRAATIERLMSAPAVTARREQSLSAAARILRGEQIRHLPVVDDEGRLVGMLSQTDLLAAGPSSLTDLDEESRSDLELPLRVSHAMVANTWSVLPGTPTAQVVRQMCERRIDCAPVVDGEARILGLVTTADLLKLLIAELIRSPTRPVVGLMTFEPVAVRAGDSLATAAELMARRRIRHLPVVDSSHRLLGVVSERDLLRARNSILRPGPPFDPSVRVEEVAHEEVWSIAPNASVLKAARLLLDHRFGCLPVMEGGALVGILTEHDLLGLLLRLLWNEAPPPLKCDVPVSYYMSEPVRWVGPDESVDFARELLEEYGVSGLAVVSESRRLLGVVTHTDFLRAGSVEGGREVAEVMSRSVRWVRASTPIVLAARSMLRHGFHRLFVVEKNEPVGVLSVADLAAAIRDLRIGHPLAEEMTPSLLTIDVCEPVEVAVRYLERSALSALLVTEGRFPAGFFSRREALAAQAARASDTTVEHVMNRRFLCLPPDMPICRAAAQAADLGVHRIVVWADVGPVGILTGTDFAAVLARLRPDVEVGNAPGRSAGLQAGAATIAGQIQRRA